MRNQHKKAVFQFDKVPEEDDAATTKTDKDLLKEKSIKRGAASKKTGAESKITKEKLVEVDQVSVTLKPPVSGVVESEADISKAVKPVPQPEEMNMNLLNDLFLGTAEAMEHQNNKPQSAFGSKKAMLISLKFIDKQMKFANPELNISRMIHRKQDKHKIEKLKTEDYKSNPGWYSGMFDNIADKYQIDDMKLIEYVESALETSQPIRNFLPLIFKQEDLNNFKTPQELTIQYPLTKAFKSSFFKHIDAYPEETMRHYFGEKIALYFGFLAFYRDSLTFPAITGGSLTLILFIYRGVDTNPSEENPTYSGGWWIEKIYEWLTVAFAVILCFWSKRFLVKWDRHEKEFSLRYGQNYDSDAPRDVRPSFIGKFARNIVTDKANSLAADESVQFKKMIATWVTVAAFSALTAYSSFAILKEKRKAYLEGTIADNSLDNFFIDGTGILFNSIEFLRIKVFEYIFFKLLTRIVQWQNLKYVDEHESQLILYLGLYQLFNNSIVIVIIGMQSLFTTVISQNFDDSSGVVEPQLGSPSCVDYSCTAELSFFFMTYCVLQLTWALVVKLIILPGLEKLNKIAIDNVKRIGRLGKNLANKLGLKTSSKGLRSPTDGLTNVEAAEIDASVLQPIENLIKDMLMDDENYKAEIESIITIHHRFPFFFYNRINEEIDRQVSHLKDYKIGDDFDQGLLDYLDLFTLYSYLALFGVLFPISFLLVAVIAWAEWKMDSRFLFNQTRRPNTSEAGTIGLWMDLVSLVSSLTVISNSFFISFILFEKKSYTWKFITFLISNIILFIGTSYYFNYRQGLSSMTGLIASRMNYIKDRLFHTSRPKNLAKHQFKMDISSKLFGEVPPSKDSKNFLANLRKEIDEEQLEALIEKRETKAFFDQALESVEHWKATQPSNPFDNKRTHTKLPQASSDMEEPKMDLGDNKDIPKDLDFGTGFD